VCDGGDFGVDLVGWAAGLAAGQGLGQFGELADGLGQGLGESDLLGGVQGR
jgi:hypothetical protein